MKTIREFYMRLGEETKVWIALGFVAAMITLAIIFGI